MRLGCLYLKKKKRRKTTSANAKFNPPTGAPQHRLSTAPGMREFLSHYVVLKGQNKVLNNLIEEAYRLFSRYKANRPLDICTHCCMSKQNEGQLASLPVREISRELLAEYNDGASTAKTPVEELKHFLPRYLDLIWHFDYPSHSVEIALRRLDPYIASEWTMGEREFLTRFAQTFFGRCLSTYPLPGNEGIDSIIILFWHGHFDIQTFLETWLNHRGVESVLHFRDLVFGGFEHLNPNKLSNPFGNSQVAFILRQWIDSHETKALFSQEIEKLILETEALSAKDLEELNLLYESLTVK